MILQTEEAPPPASPADRPGVPAPTPPPAPLTEVGGVRLWNRPGWRRTLPDHETFWYMKRMYLFDVERAKQLTADGREPVELEPDSALLAVQESDLNEAHLPKTNPAVPGIIAHVRWRTEEGELLKGHVLIDGHHRAARCLREDRPFLAYLLSEWESLEVLARCPLATLPDPDEATALRGPVGG